MLEWDGGRRGYGAGAGEVMGRGRRGYGAGQERLWAGGRRGYGAGQERFLVSIFSGTYSTCLSDLPYIFNWSSTTHVEVHTNIHT